ASPPPLVPPPMLEMSLGVQVAPQSRLKNWLTPDVEVANRFCGFVGFPVIDVSCSLPADFVTLMFGPTVIVGVTRASRGSRLSRTVRLRDEVCFGEVGDCLSQDRSEFQGMESTPEDRLVANQ